MTALVSVNLTYAILAPIPLACYVSTRVRGKGVTAVAIDLAATLVGAVGALLVFGGFYHWATGDYNFLGPSIAFLRASRAMASKWTYNGGTVFKFGDGAWIGSAVWLTLPIATAVFSSIALLMRPTDWNRDASKVPRIWMVLYLCQFCMFLVLDAFTSSTIFFQAWIYASMLMPLMILALGSLIGRVVESLDDRRYRRCFGVAGLLLAVQVAIPVSYKFPNSATISPLVLSLTPALLAIVLLMFGSRKGRGSTAYSVVAAACLLSISTYLSRRGFREEMSIPYYSMTHTTSATAEFLAPRKLRPLVQRMHRFDRFRADFYLSIVDSLRYADSFDKKNKLFFWFDMSDPYAMIYDNLACCKNWAVSIVSFSFPAPSDDPACNLLRPDLPGGLIAVVSAKPDAERLARQSLAAAGYDSRLLGSKKIEHGRIRFSVNVIEPLRR